MLFFRGELDISSSSRRFFRFLKWLRTGTHVFTFVAIHNYCNKDYYIDLVYILLMVMIIIKARLQNGLFSEYHLTTTSIKYSLNHPFTSISNPANIYLLKVNVSDVALISLLLTLNIFYTCFLNFYCWLWTGKVFLRIISKLSSILPLLLPSICHRIQESIGIKRNINPF